MCKKEINSDRNILRYTEQNKEDPFYVFPFFLTIFQVHWARKS